MADPDAGRFVDVKFWCATVWFCKQRIEATIDRAVPPEGRTVTCQGCGSLWQVLLNDESADDPEWHVQMLRRGPDPNG